MVAAGRRQARHGDLLAQLVGPVDAHVAALVGVVLIGQRPADAFGQPARDRDGQESTGSEHPHELGDRPVVLGYVLEDLRGEHHVERRVFVGHLQDVAGLDHARGLGRELDIGTQRAEHLFHALELHLVEVEGCDLGTAPQGLVGVPAGSRADLDEARHGADPQPIEVNGEHGGFLSGSMRGAWRWRTHRPRPLPWQRRSS